MEQETKPEPQSTIEVETTLWLDKPFKNVITKPHQNLIAPDKKSIEIGWCQSEGSELRLFLEEYGFSFEDCDAKGLTSKIAGIPVKFEDKNKVIKYRSKTQSEAFDKYNRKDGIKVELNKQKITVTARKCPEYTTTIKQRDCDDRPENIKNPKYYKDNNNQVNANELD